MPIQVKTMRDVWDRSKKKREMKEYKIFSLEGEENKLPSSPTEPSKEAKVRKRIKSSFDFAVAREIGKYYLEYLARKKAFSETKDEIVKAFAEYEKKLGGAGFSKI